MGLTAHRRSRGGQLISVTGFSTEFKDANTDPYKIDIRSLADLDQPVR